MRVMTHPLRGAGLRAVAAANPPESAAGRAACARRVCRIPLRARGTPGSRRAEPECDACPTAPRPAWSVRTRARATRTRPHRSGTRVPAAAPTSGSRARPRRGRGGVSEPPDPPRADPRAPTVAADRRAHSPQAIRVRPSAAAHHEPEQQGNPARDRHGLPGIATHVAVELARPRGHLLLEPAEPGAQVPPCCLCALLPLRAVGAGARPQQRFGIAYQGTQLLGQLPGIERLSHGGVPRRQDTETARLALPPALLSS